MLYQNITLFQLRDEFHAIVHTDKQLSVEWAQCKDAILTVAEEDAFARDLLAEIDDDMDEGLT